MSELSNLTRKRLEKYTVGLQNMNAEQRELLAAKEQELAELRTQLEQMDDERLSWKREAESRGEENAELRERNADNHKRAEEIIAARERQIERLREELQEEHELYIESCKNTAIQKSVRHKLEQEVAELRRGGSPAWQPIKNCPKTPKQQYWLTNGDWIRIGIWHDVRWYGSGFNYPGVNPKYDQPTHWIELPNIAAIRHSQEDREGEG